MSSMYPSLRWAQARLRDVDLAATELEYRVERLAARIEQARPHDGSALSPYLFRQEIRLEHLNEARSALRRLVRQIEYQERFPYPAGEHLRSTVALRDVWANEVRP